MSKNKKPIHTEEHEEHVDERWLVSYADMMTLLFGLFVILFSIASEKQGDFNENLKSISNSATLTKAEDTEKEKPVDAEALKKELELAEKARKEAEEKLQVANEQVIEKDKINLQQDFQLKEKEKVIAENNDLIEQLKKQLAEFKLAQMQIESELNKNKSAEEKLKDLEKKAKLELEKKQLELSDASQLKEKNKKLTQELEALALKIKSLEELLAKQPDKKQIERKIASLQEDDQRRLKQVEEKEKQIKDLSQKMSQLEDQNKKLKSEISESNGGGESKTYLFVLFKWSTEKHDLDLTVTDPKGNLFSFKKKSHAGANGIFSLDSRTGPGAEIWQSSDPVPGRYQVRVKMYNNYGNSEAAQLSGSILSNKTSIAIADKKIEAKSGSELQFNFEVDKKGFVKLL